MADIEIDEPPRPADLENQLVAVEQSLPNPPPLLQSHSDPGWQREVLAETKIGPQRSISDSNIKENAKRDGKEELHLSLGLDLILPPVLARRISSSNKVFYCGICLENHPLFEAISLQSCEKKHNFCRLAMSSYLACLVNDGRTEFKCLSSHEDCNGTFSTSEINDLLQQQPETLEKYRRFKAMKNNVHFRECPKCGKSVIGDTRNPEIVCIECGEKYCYYHANAHPDMSCAQYTRIQSRNELRSRSLISAMTIKCPTCFAETEKISGCNHISCPRCHQDWCWLCGKPFNGNPSEHYALGSMCYGGMMTPTPSWAIWSYCPMSPQTLFFLFTLWQYPFILIILIAGAAICCVGIGVCAASLVLCCPYISWRYYHGDDISALTRHLGGYPALGVMYFIAGVLGFCIMSIWVPLVALWTLCMFAAEAVGCKVITDGLLLRDDDNDRFMEIWLFPLIFALSVISPVGNLLAELYHRCF